MFTRAGRYPSSSRLPSWANRDVPCSLQSAPLPPSGVHLHLGVLPAKLVLFIHNFPSPGLIPAASVWNFTKASPHEESTSLNLLPAQPWAEAPEQRGGAPSDRPNVKTGPTRTVTYQSGEKEEVESRSRTHLLPTCLPSHELNDLLTF